jgi:hypothetical protein
MLATLTGNLYRSMVLLNHLQEHMLRSLRPSLAAFLVVLFVALSFNAYACLLPVNSATSGAMENGCSTSDGQPVSQYCDTFKTINVQSADKLHLGNDSQTICSEDTASLALLVIHTSHSSFLSDQPIIGSPQDLLLKISVLRI